MWPKLSLFPEASHPKYQSSDARCGSPKRPWSQFPPPCGPQFRRPLGGRPHSCGPGCESRVTCSARSIWPGSCPERQQWRWQGSRVHRASCRVWGQALGGCATFGFTSCCRFSTRPQGAMPRAMTLAWEREGAAALWSLTASPMHLVSPSRNPPVIIHAPENKSEV